MVTKCGLCLKKGKTECNYHKCPTCGNHTFDDDFGYSPPVPMCKTCDHYCDWQQPSHEGSGMNRASGVKIDNHRKSECKMFKEVMMDDKCHYTYGFYDGLKIGMKFNDKVTEWKAKHSKKKKVKA